MTNIRSENDVYQFLHETILLLLHHSFFNEEFHK